MLMGWKNRMRKMEASGTLACTIRWWCHSIDIVMSPPADRRLIAGYFSNVISNPHRVTYTVGTQLLCTVFFEQEGFLQNEGLCARWEAAVCAPRSVVGVRQKFHSWSRAPKAFSHVEVCLQFSGSLSNNFEILAVRNLYFSFMLDSTLLTFAVSSVR